jgi:hypothetical protein
MHFKHFYGYMNYRYCDYRYYVYYIEIEWYKRLLSGLRRQNPPASPLGYSTSKVWVYLLVIDTIACKYSRMNTGSLALPL